MPGQYDRILKETFKEVIGVIIKKVLKLDAVSITPLDTKLQITNEREPDLVFLIRLRNKSSFILHIEIQSTNDTGIPDRMMFYWLFIRKVYKKVPQQYLFYVGKRPLRMPDHMPELGGAGRYEIIDFNTIDCETFISSDNPVEIVISVLCNLRGKNGKIVVRRLLQRLKETVTGELELSKRIRQVEVLSQLKGLQEIVFKEKENMTLVYDIEKDPYYRRGKEKGATEGKREGLLEGKLEGKIEGKLEGRLEGKREGLLDGIQFALDIKYGSDQASVFDKISTIDDINRLEQIKEFIRKSPTIDDLIRLIG
ncbi:MAG: Rpn family recombination-promoting nuclease/putative transposase [Nitrospirae bacterium]|nr:Rpn family recombination-promoting nuclease/putative transposase [Nitrospirota bacterium]